MGNQERICRLCLKVCDSFKALERHIKDVLYTVLPKINLTVIPEPMICTNCLEMLIKCFDFKTNCIYTQNCVLPPVDKDNVKPDLKDAHLMESVNGTDIPADQDVCGSCMGSLNNCPAISLDVEGDVLLKKMIEQCLPKWDLSIIKKPVICASCRLSLENCFHFVTNCLNVEEKIKKYCESLDINNKGQIELSNLLHFTMRDVIKKEDVQSIDVTKVGEQFFEESENSEKRKICIEIVKLEPMFCEEECEMEDQKFLIKEEIEIKPDVNFYRFEDNINLPQPDDIKYRSRNENEKVPGYQCDCCSYLIKNKSDLKMHFLKHKDPSEITIHKCAFCPFQTKRKNDLKNHLLVHKNPSEVTMYNCEFCSFQTKYKRSLKTHLLIHKSPSEVTLYKCDSCAFEAKQKCDLKTHLLRSNHSVALMHSLKTHVLTHKSPSEVTLYKCDSCAFEAKQKRDLKTHLLRSNHAQL